MERRHETDAFGIGNLRNNCNSVGTAESAKPIELIHSLFELQAVRTPGLTAVTHNGKALTYAQLNTRANRLARLLGRKGVGSDKLVAIALERGLDMLVALIAVLKSGGAYVPLDPHYPAERLHYMLEDSEPHLVLAQDHLRERLASKSADCLDLYSLQKNARGFANQNLPPRELRLDGSNLVYVIYTSGSTGRPKGTAMCHRAMGNLLEWHQREMPLVPATRVVQFAALSFDVAFQEIFTTLSAGGTLVLLDDWVRRDARALAKFLRAERIQRLFAPPLILQSLADSCNALGWAPESLEDVITAGEQLRISPEITALFTRLSKCRLHNHYGPTETHVVTSLTLPDDRRHWPTLPSIGKPITNSRVYVLNEHRELVPANTVGEIYIGGAGLARSYLRRPELTASRFLDDRFSGGKMYRTGDLGRWGADGNLEYLGRNDDQVKIRGYRVELGEIETELMRHSGVKEAVVVAREETAGVKRLIAYMTCHTESAPTSEYLRAHLAAALPDFMIPSAFVRLAQFPLSPNGKLDRNALPIPELIEGNESHDEPPKGVLEQTLFSIWSQLLPGQRIGRNDNLFALGGNSFSIVRMLEQLHREGLGVDVRDVYENPTVAGLARVLRSEEIELPPLSSIPAGCRSITPDMLPLLSLDLQQIQRIAAEIPGGQSNIQDIYPLGPLQEGILFHHLLRDSGSDTYVLPITLAVSSRAVADRLIEALQKVIDRHDVLRTAFLWDGLPMPVQVVCRSAPLAVDEWKFDLHRDVEAQVEDWLQPQALDLRHAPLIRLAVASDPHTTECHVHLRIHHLVCDHESLETLLSETMAHLAGNGDSLHEPVQFRDHIAHTSAQGRRHNAKAFFQGKLSSVTEPTAPFGVLSVYGDNERVAVTHGKLDAALTARIRDEAKQRGISAATLFHAAWALVVAHTSGRDDVVFGSLLSGRSQGQINRQNGLGIFINTLPLRITLRGLNAAQLIERIQQEIVELLEYEHASLAVAQRCSGVAAGAPLFTSLLNYLHSSFDLENGQPWAQLGVRIVAIREWTNYPLTVSVDDHDGDFSLTVQSDRSIDPRRVLGYLTSASRSLLEALSRSPAAPALSLCILPEAERRDLTESFNANSAGAPARMPVHRLFEAQVGRTPEAVAVTDSSAPATYWELNAWANQLAHLLVGSGMQAGEYVPILMGRCLEMLVAQLAVLKAGGVYVPLDPKLPPERLEFMVNDCSAHRVLACQPPLASLNLESKRWMDYSALANEIRSQPTENLEGIEPAQPAAYVMYTSGSTGNPKGVIVPHRGIVRLAINGGYAEINASDVFAHCSNPAFDAATFEIWVPLLNGASVLIVPAEVTLDGARLRKVLSDNRVTVLFLTTALFNFHANNTEGIFAQLRYVIFGGETADANAVRRALSAGSPQHLLNAYGPTEATTFATTHSIDSLGEEQTSIPIGRPIANTRIYILDNHQRPVPMGVVGEIYIGGAGVALGYLNRPELTAERFTADVFSEDSCGRLYKTGDLGRWRQEGHIEYVGRIDDQVKLRGFRIELAEIEARLRNHPGVSEASVLIRGQAAEKSLVAYVTPRSSTRPTAADLRTQLRAVLPEYMVPGAFVVLDHLPLTTNGKVDRRALPEPSSETLEAESFAAPVGETEVQLAEIWREVLQVARLSRHADFFDLGGHSLLATQAVIRARALWSIELAFSALFKAPTLQQFAEHIDQQRDEQLLQVMQSGGSDLKELLDRVSSLPEAEVHEWMRALHSGEANG
jgi:amino acid adenylation domain-containing protein